jgi:hypothetical protein
MTALLAQAALLPGSVDALVPVLLVVLLVRRQVRRAAAGPGAEPPPARFDGALVPLLMVFALIVVLQAARLL